MRLEHEKEASLNARNLNYASPEVLTDLRRKHRQKYEKGTFKWFVTLVSGYEWSNLDKLRTGTVNEKYPEKYLMIVY